MRRADGPQVKGPEKVKGPGSVEIRGTLGSFEAGKAGTVGMEV
jgi:hypothetical protein